MCYSAAVSIHPGQQQREKNGLGGARLHQFLLSVQEVFPLLQRILRAHTSTCSTHIANKVIYTILCQHSLPIPSADKDREYERSPSGHVTKLGWVSSVSATPLVVEAPGAALFLCWVLIVTE